MVSDGVFSGAAMAPPTMSLCRRWSRAFMPAEERLPTEWILLTSGTTGRPKMVLHTLASLSGSHWRQRSRIPK